MKVIKYYSEIKTWEDYQAAKITYFKSAKGRQHWFRWLMDEFSAGKTCMQQRDLLDYIIRTELSEPAMADKIFGKRVNISKAEFLELSMPVNNNTANTPQDKPRTQGDSITTRTIVISSKDNNNQDYPRISQGSIKKDLIDELFK
jgi:hypothetical protein